MVYYTTRKCCITILPCHRKYSGLLFEIWAEIRYATHDGKVELNTVEYTLAFLNSDWVYFFWHGIKHQNTMNFPCGTKPVSRAGKIAPSFNHCPFYETYVKLSLIQLSKRSVGDLKP